MTAAARDGAWKNAIRDLRRLRQMATRWRARHSGFDALAPGIHETHRLGGKALARAPKTQRAQDFHVWRKQVKTLRYQLRLLEHSGAPIRRATAALHKAEAWLGEEHNLVVLCELWREASPCHGLVDLDR